jgi:hypothetical protein
MMPVTITTDWRRGRRGLNRVPGRAASQFAVDGQSRFCLLVPFQCAM